MLSYNQFLLGTMKLNNDAHSLYLSIFCNSVAIHVNLLQFELPEDARSRVKKISVIRNLCLKVGTKDHLKV